MLAAGATADVGTVGTERDSRSLGANSGIGEDGFDAMTFGRRE